MTDRDLAQLAYETWQSARGVPNELGDHGWSMATPEMIKRWTATADAVAERVRAEERRGSGDLARDLVDLAQDAVRTEERDRLRSYLAKALTDRVVTIHAIPGTHIQTIGTLAGAETLAKWILAEIAVGIDRMLDGEGRVDRAAVAREITQMTEGWDDDQTATLMTDAPAAPSWIINRESLADAISMMTMPAITIRTATPGELIDRLTDAIIDQLRTVHYHQPPICGHLVGDGRDMWSGRDDNLTCPGCVTTAANTAGASDAITRARMLIAQARQSVDDGSTILSRDYVIELLDALTDDVLDFKDPGT